MRTTSAVGNPLLGLPQYGQSVCLDGLRRRLITSGELRRLVEEDGLRGVTSNPAIVAEAIRSGLSLDTVADRLLADGVEQCVAAFERVFDAIRRVTAASEEPDRTRTKGAGSPAATNRRPTMIDNARRPGSPHQRRQVRH